MAKKPSRVVVVSDVNQVVVSADPADGAIIRLAVPAEADLDLKMSAPALAKLEAMLASANVAQAKFQKVQ